MDFKLVENKFKPNIDIDFSLINNIVNDTAKQLSAKKDSLIAERIKERVGIEFNPKEEIKLMFPRLKCAQVDYQEERWYWNDGSPKGLLLITFFNEPVVSSKLDDFNSSFSAHIRYI